MELEAARPTAAPDPGFERVRAQIVGIDATFPSPYGDQRIVYADWTASGRLYAPIERLLLDGVGPYVANTHSESSTTGALMTRAYEEAHAIIKRHVHAAPDDVIITAGAGMTTVANKLVRMLGLRVPEQLATFCAVPDALRPVVFLTHMEHHSNQTPWIETIAQVEILEPDADGRVSPAELERALETHHANPLKIGSFTACSNVTGIETPYHDLARVMHAHGGHCFVDFAASAPYVDIDMHPPDPAARLDAVFFSPHKFLGGPGSAGVLVFDREWYRNRVPDQPGGGTVSWTNPWKEHRFVDNIEVREDGGTPGFLQAIRAALAIRLKETMGIGRMIAREHTLVRALLEGLKSIPRLHVLAGHLEDRLGIVSFFLEDLHYNLVVRLLNDRFGIQARGGCSCAGTYGHYLLHVDPNRSRAIAAQIDHGDLSAKLGWVRVSLHPTSTHDEVARILDALLAIAAHGPRWAADYAYSSATNEFRHRTAEPLHDVSAWFDLPGDD